MKLDHGAIGNGRVLALVGPETSIDWLCLPRFDSPSIFARLLDADAGGTFRILASGGGELLGRLAYLDNTNVVRTVFEDGDAAWETIDFAPRLPEGLAVRAPIAAVRLLRPLRGQPTLRVDFDPRPDYARAAAAIREIAGGLEVSGGAGPVHLTTNCPLPYLRNRSDFVLHEPLFFVLSWGPP
jgi:GH15 family glucan-1,4-alpha-glucosidase